MSDISGPPLPKPVEPVNRTTGKSSAVSKDPNQTQTEAREHKGENSSKNDQSEQVRGREPAVSISATAAHLEVGERLKEKVTKVDNEGRPIIVTETATFALRPDAGLRPGDDVRLEIVEAGSKLAADLHERNGRSIDPPVRLSLIVIAIHARPPDAAPSTASPEAPLLPAKSGYGPAVLAKQSQVAPTEALVNMLGRVSQPLPTPPVSAAYTPPATLHKYTAEAGAEKISPAQTGNPDFLASRNSSPDLATLIAAQQGSKVPQSGYPKVQGQDGTLARPADPTHMIPKSILTEVPAASPLDGLGPAIRAFSFSGQSHTVQVMNPSTSQVPPARVATVLSVRPLPPDEAKSLPLPITAFNAAGGTLAVVETNKGNFVIPLKHASDLNGELVKISEPEGASEPPSGAQATTFNATLTPPGSGQRKAVTIVLNPTADAAGQVNVARVKAVHTVRAFLTPTGPSADFKIETSRGELFVTMPNSFHPSVDDPLEIIPQHASPQTMAGAPHHVMTNAAPSIDAATQLAAGPALGSIGVHHWPALEHSFATIVGADPAAATHAAARGAQGGGNLANSLLFFLNAAGRGSPEAWLGQDAARHLQQANKSLFDVFRSEMSRLMQSATDTTAEWRPALVPLEFRLQDMPLIAMLFGPPPRDDDSDKGRGSRGQEGGEEGDAQRFVLEVQFSVLGAIQLDGLIREQKFDLAMRAEKPLPTLLKREASDLFDSALAANGYSGQLTISEAAPFPIDVEAIMKASM